MPTFLKIGGSLITDKTREATFLEHRMKALAAAISAARTANPSLQLLLGHGSGSFGHFEAKRHGTIDGVKTAEQWKGFAAVSRAAAKLNRLVADTLDDAGVPVWSITPSSSAECADGKLRFLEVRPIQAALHRGLVPLVFGDVALDTVRGGTIISTETIFFYLTPVFFPRQIVLLGEVPGVLDSAGQVIRLITPATLKDVEASLGGSRGIDVTGGMYAKVHDMVRLVETFPGLTIHIMSGLEPGAVRRAILSPESAPGTVIAAT